MSLKRIFNLFADILEYPQVGLVESVQECEALVAPIDSEASALLREFRVFVEEMPLARLEEVYTSTFDLNATCYPYVGYHLLGESYKRSAFLQGLKERYLSCGFAFGNELPDHLAVLLRFLAACNETDLREELIRDALLPALKLMIEGGEDGRHNSRRALVHANPYSAILRALQPLLQQQLGTIKRRYESGNT